MSRYDGLVVITDGRAPRPDIPPRFRGHILWILYDDGAYRKGFRTLPEHCRWIAAWKQVPSFYRLSDDRRVSNN